MRKAVAIVCVKGFNSRASSAYRQDSPPRAGSSYRARESKAVRSDMSSGARARTKNAAVLGKFDLKPRQLPPFSARPSEYNYS
jgi:hypothetical protein